MGAVDILSRDKCSKKCARYDECVNTPVLPGMGNKDASILIVGDATNKVEDNKGRPFAGIQGKVLHEVLHSAGINIKDVYITNSVKCTIENEKIKVRAGTVKKCRVHLQDEINMVQPNVIVALGATALIATMDRTGLMRLKNNVFISDVLEKKVKVIPLVHPNYILRNPEAKEELIEGLKLAKKEAKDDRIVETNKEPTHYFFADTPDKIDKVLKKLESVDHFAFDLETTSLNYLDADITLLGLSWKGKKNVGVAVEWSKITPNQMSRLEKVFASDKLKIGHNVKYDIQVLLGNKIKIKGPFFDTMIACSLIDENMQEKSLNACVLRWTDLGEYWAGLDEWISTYLKENKMKKDDFSYGMIPYDILVPYAQGDADATYRLFKIFDKELKEEGLDDFFFTYSMPTMNVLLEMEFRGVKIDREKLAALIEKTEKKLGEAKQEVYDLPTVKVYENDRKAEKIRELRTKCSESKVLSKRHPDPNTYVEKMLKEEHWKFKHGSIKQLQEILFEKPYYNLTPIAFSEQTEKPKTDKETLEELDKQNNPLAKKILNFRKIDKYLGTYQKPVYEKSKFDGRIHTQFHQTRATTGRLASSNPNMQNIGGEYTELKSCFVADPGMIIVKADLGQAEFRCWAHLSNDRDMINDIESGLDIHRRTAAEIWNKPQGDVTKEERSIAKTCVFGTMYGRGAKAIADQFGIKKEEAQKVREVFFSRYPKAEAWLNQRVQEARKTGKVKTWMGRIRHLPEIWSDDHMVSAEAERQAKNSPIQGLASDLNNHYMVNNIRLARRDGIKCFPCATIHDANIIQVNKGQEERFMRIMDYVLNNSFPDFRCQMILDYEVGYDFTNTKEVLLLDSADTGMDHYNGNLYKKYLNNEKTIYELWELRDTKDGFFLYQTDTIINEEDSNLPRGKPRGF